MFEAFLDAVDIIFRWPTLLYPIFGTIFGNIIGLLPGLGGATAIALLLPLTYGMDVHEAILLLMAAQGGSAFGGSITAILLNAPGSPVNAATCLDGYAMTKQGRAGEAIGASATASALGAIFGLVILVCLIPMMRRIVLMFGPPEFFALAVVGLFLIASVMGKSLSKGIISAGMGLTLSFIGYNSISGGSRYTFGISSLWDGIGLIPAVVGLFAVAEAITLMSKKKEAIVSQEISTPIGQVFKGVKAVFTNFGLFIRCSSIGTLVGSIPGVGGTVANFISYSQAAQTDSDPSSFGKGNIKGVIAPEASNDACDGGALIPTLALGLPGSVFTAVLLGAFVLHGIKPGRSLFADHLPLVWIIILGLLISNILTSVLGIVFSRQLVKIATKIPTSILGPVIFVLCLVGTYAVNNQFYDSIVTIGMGLLGYFMTKYNYSRIAMTIALVLAPTAERSFHQTLQIQGPELFFTRPITLVLFAFGIFILFTNIRRALKRKGKNSTD